jgi:hypothetical protein
MRWIRNKYKRLRPTKKATTSWQRITRQHPSSSSTAHGCAVPGGQDDKSPVTRAIVNTCGSRDRGHLITPKDCGSVEKHSEHSLSTCLSVGLSDQGDGVGETHQVDHVDVRFDRVR